jgi:hypothetical protein
VHAGHGMITHVIQRVTTIIADCEDPPEPLDNLQVKLPDRWAASSTTSSRQQPLEGTSNNGTVANGNRRSDLHASMRTERIWMHAPRQNASAAPGGHLEPVLMLSLGGSFWRLYVHALPALAHLFADSSASLGHTGLSTPLAGGSTFSRAGGDVVSSCASDDAARVVFGNGVDASSVAASPTASAAGAVGDASPRQQQRLPHSRLQELAVPLAGTAAVNGNGTMNGTGLCCVRMFWNALVGDVGIAQHADGSMTIFPADDFVSGGVGGSTSFWGTSAATAAPDEATTSAGTSDAPNGQAKAGGSGKRKTEDFDNSSSASRRVGEGLADETWGEGEKAMYAAYHVERPNLPQASGDLPSGSNPSDVKHALDLDAAALMSTGVNKRTVFYERLMHHLTKYFDIHEVAKQSAGLHQAKATGLLMTADFDLSYSDTYPRIACTATLLSFLTCACEIDMQALATKWSGCLQELRTVSTFMQCF